MPFSLSASTIKGWFQYRCERKTRYDIMTSAELAAAKVTKDERTQAWADFGNVFEDLVIRRLRETAAVLSPVGGAEQLSQARTIAFLSGQVPVTYAAQASLEPGPSVRRVLELPEGVSLRRSYPDLIRIDHVDGAPVFTIIDVKATRSSTAFHKAQVALYARLLQGMLSDLGVPGRVAAEGEIWCIAPGVPATEGRSVPDRFALAPYLRLVDDFFRRDLPKIASRRVGSGHDDTFFHIYFKCEQCSYLVHCRRAIETVAPAGRDVSAVPGVSHEAKRALLARRIGTVGALAATPGLAGAGPSSWSMQRRADALVARAGAILHGNCVRHADVHSYLMPPKADVAFFLSADHDPVEDNLVTLGYLRRQGGVGQPMVRVLPDGGDGAERQALVDVLGALIGDLAAVDAHNQVEENPPLHAHIFLYEPAEAKALQAAVARHLKDPMIRGTLLHAVRLFPPDDVVPEPEFRGVHHLPATALRSVIEQLFALPAQVSYDLRQVSGALAATGALQVSYDPPAPFRRDFSSLLSMEVVRGLRHRDRRGVSRAEIAADVTARLETVAALTEWLWRENAAGRQFLRLAKAPFRFQETLDPLNAADLDLLQAYELLETRSQLLETLVRLAQPARVRQASGECLGGLTLTSSGKFGNRTTWFRFQVPPESRDSELSPDHIGLILTNDDPDIRLNQQRWPEFEVSLRPGDGRGDGIFAHMRSEIAEGTEMQRLLRTTGAGGWYIDRAWKDINGPRIQAFLSHLDA
jgi:hypothetical protein